MAGKPAVTRGDVFDSRVPLTVTNAGGLSVVGLSGPVNR